MYVYVWLHVCACMLTRVYVRVGVYVHVCVYVYVGMYVYMYVCMHVCMCARMCAFAHESMILYLQQMERAQSARRYSSMSKPHSRGLYGLSEEFEVSSSTCVYHVKQCFDIIEFF